MAQMKLRSKPIFIGLEIVSGPLKQEQATTKILFMNE